MEEIPSEILNTLEEGSCVAFNNSKVVCLSTDVPKNTNAETELEVDRGETPQELLIRHIILDDPQNPLYIEYYADREFIEKMTSIGKVEVLFVNSKHEILKKFMIILGKDDIRFIKREIGLSA
ncbi:MAG: hypothetical protein JZD40_01380 [Sulfolobus sp.]|nr:hypothetical protein [Sulfolobus sp.]